MQLINEQSKYSAAASRHTPASLHAIIGCQLQQKNVIHFAQNVNFTNAKPRNSSSCLPQNYNNRVAKRKRNYDTRQPFPFWQWQLLLRWQRMHMPSSSNNGLINTHKQTDTRTHIHTGKNNRAAKIESNSYSENAFNACTMNSKQTKVDADQIAANQQCRQACNNSQTIKQWA